MSIIKLEATFSDANPELAQSCFKQLVPGVHGLLLLTLWSSLFTNVLISSLNKYYSYASHSTAAPLFYEIQVVRDSAEKGLKEKHAKIGPLASDTI